MYNDEIDRRINQRIQGERYRRILHRKLVDKITYEALAEEENMSVRGVQQVVYRHRGAIFGESE